MSWLARKIDETQADFDDRVLRYLIDRFQIAWMSEQAETRANGIETIPLWSQQVVKSRAEHIVSQIERMGARGMAKTEKGGDA